MPSKRVWVLHASYKVESFHLFDGGFRFRCIVIPARVPSRPEMSSPLDVITVQSLSTEDARQRQARLSIREYSPNHHLTMFPEEPPRKPRQADSILVGLSQHLGHQLALSATYTIVSHIRDTDVIDQTSSSSSGTWSSEQEGTSTLHYECFFRLTKKCES